LKKTRIEGSGLHSSLLCQELRSDRFVFFYSFYKKELTVKDWLVAAENEPMLLLVKGQNQITVSFMKSPDNDFDYFITLFKGN
jgi:hypothetical protein